MQRLRTLARQVPPLSLALRWLGGLGLVLALVASFTELAEDVWFREGFAWDAPLILALAPCAVMCGLGYCAMCKSKGGDAGKSPVDLPGETTD